MSKCEACGTELPEAKAAGSMEELDDQIACLQTFPKTQGMLLALRPLAVLAQRAGGAEELEKLVEAEECKQRIVEAGCNWVNWSCGVLRVHVNGCGTTPTQDCEDWPAAAEWAEAQAKPKERWSEPVGKMSRETKEALMDKLGGLHRKGWMMDTYYLRGLARDAWDPATDRILLPEPEVAV